MESTPFDYDDIVMTILLYLDLKEIKKLCQTQSRINIICADEHFWKLKLNHDFDSTFLDYKNRHKTWKETYEYVYLLHLDFNQLQYKHLNEQFWKDKYNLDFIFGQCIKTALLDLSWKKLYQFAKNVGTEFPILSYPFTDADLNRLYEGLVMPPKKSPHAEDFVDEIGELLESDNWGLVMIKNNKKIPLYNSYLIDAVEDKIQDIYETDVREIFMDNPSLLMNQLDVGDQLIIYMFFAESWGVIITHLPDGYDMDWYKSYDYPY